MKLRSFITTCAIWLSAPTLVFSQFPGSSSSVTFSLTFTYSAPGLAIRDALGKPVKGEGSGLTYSDDWEIDDTKKQISTSTFEYASKMVTKKYGNKELLTDLVNAGRLPTYGEEPYIAGWSIQSVHATLGDGDDDMLTVGESRLYAIHKTEGDIIDLTNYIALFPTGDDYAEKGTAKKITKEFYEDPENTFFTGSYAADLSWRESLGMIIDFNGIPESYPGNFTGFALLEGIANLGDKMVGVGVSKIPTYIAKAGKISGISGEGPVLDDIYQDRSVVEGSISFAAGKVVEDIYAYPDLEIF